MKGTISESLQAILNDNDGRKQLRRLLVSRKDGQVKVGDTVYNVSTKSDPSSRNLKPGRTRAGRTVSSLRRSAG